MATGYWFGQFFNALRRSPEVVMIYSHKPPHEILEDFRDEGFYPLAFPAIWNGGEAVICRCVPLTAAARTLAEHPNAMIRALFAVHVTRNCKRELNQLATDAGVHLAL
jgi:hypothetical protein